MARSRGLRIFFDEAGFLVMPVADDRAAIDCCRWFSSLKHLRRAMRLVERAA